MQQKYIAAIDLGTAKTALAVARIQDDDIQIEYYGETPSDGIRNSKVYNPMRASAPIRRVISAAEQQLGIHISQVVVGLPRYSVTQETASGTLPRNTSEEYISREEVELLKDMALSQYPLSDTKNDVIYGVVAQSFSTAEDIQLVENDVIGTLSDSITGNFKIFVGNRTATKAIDGVFDKLGVAIAKKYFLPDVVARAVLSDDEMENGVGLIDFGAGVSSVSVYLGGIMRHYGAIPFGGNNITSDIRCECSISEKLAENIKLAYGACQPSRLATLSEKILQIRSENVNKKVSVKYLSEIIDARAREIIDALLYEIQKSELQDLLRSGLVLTGGGARLANFANLLKEVSGYNVRIGYPAHKFISTGYALGGDTAATSAIGMVLSAKYDNLPDCIDSPAPPDWITNPFTQGNVSGTESADDDVEAVDGTETVTAGVYTDENGDGTLFPEVDDGVKQGGEEGKKPSGKKNRGNAFNGLKLTWKKMEEKMGELFVNITKEEV